MLNDVFIGDEKVSITSQIKLLGLEIDEKLTFKSHVKKTCSKLSYISHILSKFYTMPQPVRRKIYYAYAHPIINYGISLWGLSYKTHLKPLIKLQNSLIKKVSSTKNNNITEVYKNLKILNINSLKNYSLCCNMHKIISKRSPLLLQEIINQSFIPSIRCTRSKESIRKPAIKLTIMKRSFRWAAPTIYNSVPCAIKSNNYKNFKSKILLYLLDNQKM